MTHTAIHTELPKPPNREKHSKATPRNTDKIIVIANNNNKALDNINAINTRVDSRFGDYFMDQKIYLIPEISKSRACQIMGVSTYELTLYLQATHDCSVRRAVNEYRVEEALERTPQATLTELSRAVGYCSVVLFVYRFICHLHCLPATWRKRYL